MEFASPAMEVVVDTPVHDDASARDARPKHQSRRWIRGGSSRSAAAEASPTPPPPESHLPDEAPHPSFYEGLFPKEKRVQCCGRWFWWDSLYGTTAKYFGGGCVVLSVLVTAAVLLTLYVSPLGLSRRDTVVLSTLSPSLVPTPIPTTAPSPSPTSTQRQGLVQFLSSGIGAASSNKPISSLLDLTTAGTPQFQALEWVERWAVSQNKMLEVDSVFPTWISKYILAVLYYSTGGDEWSECHAQDPLCHLGNQNYPFLSPTIHECDWYGIQCGYEREEQQQEASTTTESEKDMQIHQISLAYPNNMAGTLPSELAMLPELASILIGRQPNMHGIIPPEWADLPKLETLAIIHMPALTGPVLPASFANHPALSLLVLSNGANGHAGVENDEEEGQFPSVITTLTQLKLLALLTYKNMTGPLPDDVSQWTNIESIYLNDNGFRGAIPTSWSQLDKLESLDVSSNQLDGTLSPQLFGNWTRMRYWNISDNEMSGSLPSPEIGSLGSAHIFDDNDDDEDDSSSSSTGEDDDRRQRHFDFSNNRFTGTIPPEMANAQQLVHLFLDRNDFVGDVPLELCALRTQQDEEEEEDIALAFELQELTVDCSRVSCSCCTNCDGDPQHHWDVRQPNRERCEKEPWWTGCASQQERS